MNPPEWDPSPIYFGPFSRHLAKPPTLSTVLQILEPMAIEDTFAIAEGYILLNDYYSAKCLYEQVRSDIEALAWRSYDRNKNKVYYGILELIDNNLDCIEDIIACKINLPKLYSGSSLGMKKYLEMDNFDTKVIKKKPIPQYNEGQEREDNLEINQKQADSLNNSVSNVFTKFSTSLYPIQRRLNSQTSADASDNLILESRSDNEGSDGSSNSISSSENALEPISIEQYEKYRVTVYETKSFHKRQKTATQRYVSR